MVRRQEAKRGATRNFSILRNLVPGSLIWVRAKANLSESFLAAIVKEVDASGTKVLCTYNGSDDATEVAAADCLERNPDGHRADNCQLLHRNEVGVLENIQLRCHKQFPPP
jgi:hypothetical protein